ncbi:MAG TPA: RNA polymerase sigma factor SigJ [Steroidobacteraceae bacterium]|jgi:RNA polymerase sigma-70 factor (ECF subfamily)|nr:RNA polymerase sigma factor SigJ [Steroidobacteraceae bacterium]
MQAEIENRHSAAFAENRGRLWSIAYRMLGSRADADDAVQDAYLRWHGAHLEEIRSPQAWLVTTITRLCLDRLKQLRAEREHYTGPWLPEPIVEEPHAPDKTAELASELSVALLTVLERLAPEERAAFLLHEMFDSGYDDIAQILGKSEAACRQIVSRAVKRVRAERPRVHVSAEAKQRLLDGLVQALQTHDKDALLKILAKDSAWISDGGGKARAALKVIRGAESVARFGTGVYRKIRQYVTFQRVVVNGEPGYAGFYNGRLFSVITIRTDGERILNIFTILNPDKLRAVEVTKH